MNRRGFLGALFAGGAALALDPERALWVPGAKTIFIPAAPFTLETTGNVMVPHEWITREALAVIRSHLHFQLEANRVFSQQFEAVNLGQSSALIGRTA